MPPSTERMKTLAQSSVLYGCGKATGEKFEVIKTINLCRRTMLLLMAKNGGKNRSPKALEVVMPRSPKALLKIACKPSKGVCNVYELGNTERNP